MRKLLPIIFLTLLAAFSAACSEGAKKARDLQAGQADSLIFDAGKDKDYDYMLALVDSFERDGSISAMDANRWRGTAHYRLGQYRSSEFYYKKVLDAEIVQVEPLHQLECLVQRQAMARESGHAELELHLAARGLGGAAWRGGDGLGTGGAQRDRAEAEE